MHFFSPAARWRALRRAGRDRRTARVTQRVLEEEVATYQTPGEHEELDAILGRYDDRESAEIRDFLHRSPGRAA
jgi:ABC-type nitrate/sulfonate/bicarbonate transport system substrate-binding protein